MTWDQVVMLVVLVVGYAWVIRQLVSWKQRPQVTTRKDPTINQDQARAETMVKLASMQGKAAKGLDTRRGEQVAGVISPKGKAS